ncbi:MAG TPA: hypothetical protein VF603_07450 [Allosphingosinicella sp.]|jgi:hypothetical protein
MAALTERPFDTPSELADAAVSFVVGALGQIRALPGKLRGQILHEHAEICYGLLRVLSGTVSAALSRRGGPCGAIGAEPLNCALVSIVSFAISLCIRDERLIIARQSQTRMRNLFLAGIAPLPPTAD